MERANCCGGGSAGGLREREWVSSFALNLLFSRCYSLLSVAHTDITDTRFKPC